jgi:hypothetical protein
MVANVANIIATWIALVTSSPGPVIPIWTTVEHIKARSNEIITSMLPNLVRHRSATSRLWEGHVLISTTAAKGFADPESGLRLPDVEF